MKKKKGGGMAAFLGDAGPGPTPAVKKASETHGTNSKDGARGSSGNSSGSGMFGWIGSVFGGSGSSNSTSTGKNYTKAHMGSSAKPYYDKAQGRWIIPGMNDKPEAVSAPPPPPPPAAPMNAQALPAVNGTSQTYSAGAGHGHGGPSGDTLPLATAGPNLGGQFPGMAHPNGHGEKHGVAPVGGSGIHGKAPIPASGSMPAAQGTGRRRKKKLGPRYAVQ